MGRRKVDLTGKRFGRLVVLCEDPHDPKRVICKCDCGTVKSISRAQMNGKTRSCGCLLREQGAASKENFKGAYEFMRRYHTQMKALYPKRIPKNNTSGVIGVSQTKNGKYTAYITLNYKQKYLGTYSTFDEAVEARKEAEHTYYDPILKMVEDDKRGIA